MSWCTRPLVATVLLACATGCGPSGVQEPPPAARPPAAPGGPSAPAAPAGPLAIPLSVTTHFQNQGWFADPGLEKLFQPGSSVIRQVDGSDGPCAARVAQARGKCIKVTYTPPPGLMPPAAGGWVGVFFLTSVTAEHPEATPPVHIGDANWGVEPGRSIAAGATKISFQGAADRDGQPVTFKAGTDKDTFMIPDQKELLGTAWKPYALALTSSYGNNVVGGFAWVLTDTTKPATFYLDNIVWE
jgi:hypothetical protein